MQNKITQKSKLQAEIGFFRSLKEETTKILREFDEFNKAPVFDFDIYNLQKRQRFTEKFIKTAKRLCDEYSREYFKANELLEFDSYNGLQYVPSPTKEENPDEWYSVLQAVLLASNKAIEGLNARIFESECPIINFRKIKEKFLSFSKFNLYFSNKKWFTMNNPLVWLLFSLALIIISYFIHELLK
jgi:hypothetical protein